MSLSHSLCHKKNSSLYCNVHFTCTHNRGRGVELPLVKVFNKNISSGVQVVENVCVEGVEVEQGRVCGVRTDKGTIKCETFVNTAGQVSVCEEGRE